MTDQHFTDGIGSISMIGGAVRLDFFTFSPIEKEANGQAKAILDHRMIMTLPGFLQCVAKMREAADAIAKAQQPPAPAVIAEPAAAPVTPPAKPNFP